MSVFDVPVPVDRTSPMWLRLRAATQHAAWYVDLDDHTDRVYRTLCERVGRYPRNTTAAASATLDGTLLAAAARRP